jgi:hypothetical protein
MRMIRRNFGRNMPKEVQLRFHEITANSVLQFRSEIPSLKRNNMERLDMKLLKLTAEYRLGGLMHSMNQLERNLV